MYSVSHDGSNRKVLWQELLRHEFEAALEQAPVVILPVGSVEQHGPHCPCGDDDFNAIGMAELISKKTGVMLLPCPMYGSHPYHHWKMPGNIPLTYETHIALLMDIVRGASHAGYNKFIILSAHGQVSSTIVAVPHLFWQTGKGQMQIPLPEPAQRQRAVVHCRAP